MKNTEKSEQTEDKAKSDMLTSFFLNRHLNDDKYQSVLKELEEKDPKLIPMFREMKDFDIQSLIKDNVFVALVGAIVGQKISFAKARSVRSNVYKLLGTDFSYQDISNIADAELLKTGMSTDNLTAVRKACFFIQENKLNLQNVDELRKLKQVRGIGDWTINNVLLMCLLDTDAFCSGDSHIQKRVKELYGLTSIGPKLLEEISVKWRPYRAIVCWYLWRYKLSM